MLGRFNRPMTSRPSTGPGTARHAAVTASTGSARRPPRRASHASGIAARTAVAAAQGPITSDQPNSRRFRHGDCQHDGQALPRRPTSHPADIGLRHQHARLVEQIAQGHGHQQQDHDGGKQQRRHAEPAQGEDPGPLHAGRPVVRRELGTEDQRGRHHQGNHDHAGQRRQGGVARFHADRGPGVDFFRVRAHDEQVGDGHFAGSDDGGPESGHSDRGQCAAKRDVKEHLPRRTVQVGLLFQFRFHQPQAGADDQHDPGHGRHGVDPDGPAPAFQPRGGGIRERAPALGAEAGLPGRRQQIQRHQRQQPHDQQCPAAAGKIRPHQQPCQRGPQRQADGAGGRGEQQGIQHERPGTVVHAQ